MLPQTLGLAGAPLAYVMALVASHAVLLVRVSRLAGLPYAEVWPLGMLGRILAACLVSAIPVLLLKSANQYVAIHVDERTTDPPLIRSPQDTRLLRHVFEGAVSAIMVKPVSREACDE